MTRHEVDPDPLLQSLEVPYICDYGVSLTKVPFLDVPTRYHLDWRAAQDPSSTSLGPDEAAIFLQEWLFFSVLNAICDLVEVEFNPSDFVSSSVARGQQLVTGSQFGKYVWFWAGAVASETSLSLDRFWEQVNRAAFILDVLQKTTNAWVQRVDYAASAHLDLVLLSIVQLNAHLRLTLPFLLRGLKLDPKSQPSSKIYPTYGRDLLLKAGWCVGELPALLARYEPFTLLYLSQLDRRRDEKDHTGCSEQGCVVNQLDWRTYKTAHSISCQGPGVCTIIHAPTQKISEVLEAGDIPLVSIAVDSQSMSPLLQVEGFALGREQRHVTDRNVSRYVAISHVWSDGMGNPGANALYACQIRRIQSLVNDLYSRAGDSAITNVLFWMDTLCVPLDRRIRSLAIARMARTYLHADKVLVMDDSLMKSSLHRDGAKRLLFKIIHSDWNTRLWTFHEAVLAKECFFQFADAVLTFNQLEAASRGPTGLEEVSAILSGIEEGKLLSTKCTLNLLRAMAYVDPSGVDRSHQVKLTAVLPPQDDPHQELDRHIAIRSEAYHNILCMIVEKWIPVLAKADSHSEDPESDQLRLNGIILPWRTDPATAHAVGRATFIRGFGFEYAMKRSEDLARGTARQLLGNQHSPSSQLASIVAGVRGRLTSWREDETICLGGLINMDVTDIARVRVDSDRTEEQVSNVCEERMKTFLSAIQTFPESILFWSSTRLTTYPWRWAPASFLNADRNLPFVDFWKARCTDQGLLVNCNTIKILPNQKNIVRASVKDLRLRQKASEVHQARPFAPIGQGDTPSNALLFTLQIVNMNQSNESWYDFFIRHDGELYLLKKSYPLRKGKDADAILVRILRVENETWFAYYLTKVRCIQTVNHEPGPYVDGELEPTKIQWCVG